MTEERLMQYRGLIKEIEQLKSKIESTKQDGPSMVTDTVSSAAEFPYSKHTVSVTGLAVDDYNKRMLRVEQRRKRMLERAEKELECLEEYIASVPDACIRAAMRYKYIDGMGWLWISRKVYGKTDESYSRRKVHKFLKVADFAGFPDV